MSCTIGLFINNVEIPLTQGAYDESWEHYQITGKTEAGTNRRDLIRSNILGLNITLQTTEALKNTLLTYNDEASLTVKYYADGVLTTWDAYMDDFSCKLQTEDLWEVSFKLVDLEQ